MQTALQILLTSLQIGAIYVLFSLGLTLIFGVMRVVNFAHGQFFTLAALLVAVIDPWLAARGWAGPLAYVVAVLAGVGAAILLGAIVYRFGFRYFQRDLIGSFILSVGLVLLCEGVFLDVFGGSAGEDNGGVNRVTCTYRLCRAAGVLRAGSGDGPSGRRARTVGRTSYSVNRSKRTPRRAPRRFFGA